MWRWYNILAIIFLILGLLLLIGGGIWYFINKKNNVSLSKPEWTIFLGVILLLLAGIFVWVGYEISYYSFEIPLPVEIPGDAAFRQQCRDMNLVQLRQAQETNPLITEKCTDIIRGKAFRLEP